MERQLFADLYAKAQEHRNELQGNSELHEFFSSGWSRPPVLGFGLPKDNRPVPVVTIALNAANDEFPDHLPIRDDVQTQWDAQAQ